MTDVQSGLGTIEHVDPTQIEVETNIRTVVALSREFVDSIREHGVLQPVLCRRRPDGTLVVRAWQRRVLGAREAQRPTVPAYVVEGEESTVTRLVEQFVENDHRDSLTVNERAAVFLQMELEGLSVPTIAKRTGVKKAEVEAGIKVAQSQFAKDVVEEQSLTRGPDRGSAAGDDCAAGRGLVPAFQRPPR
jgi:ParB family transcriptional regulator, chromosome partitioning protein